MKHNPRIIITGGPGAGKTTLINALRQRGFVCHEESGRTIIQDQVRICGSALPWISPILFAELMLAMDMRSWHLAENSTSTVFYDRGIPDIAGYLALTGENVAEHFVNAINQYRYAATVVLLPPWKTIYQQDTERKQSWNEAVNTYDAMVATYEQYGYRLFELPPAPLSVRINHLLQALAP